MKIKELRVSNKEIENCWLFQDTILFVEEEDKEVSRSKFFNTYKFEEFIHINKLIVAQDFINDRVIIRNIRVNKAL